MKRLSFSITLLLLSTLAFGQVPNTFSSGETISSSKINANFSFLANAMGSGNVTAMMHCGGEVGIVDVDNTDRVQEEVYTSPQVAYSNCHTTDNTSLIPTSKLCTLPYYNYDEGLGGWYCTSWQGIKSRRLVITAQSLLAGNWILSQSIFMQDQLFINVFYKVSSD